MPRGDHLRDGADPVKIMDRLTAEAYRIQRQAKTIDQKHACAILIYIIEQKIKPLFISVNYNPHKLAHYVETPLGGPQAMSPEEYDESLKRTS